MGITRRDILKAGAVLSFGGTVPSVLLRAATAPGRADRVLVVVQLSGGNDGLNTVVPFAEDAYRRARPTLAVADVLKIDDAVGFHPALRGFADLLEAGRLAVVQGVGYPEPNRSHFESMDIWHTCRRRGREPRTEGWLGRALVPGDDDPAIHLGGEPQPLALASATLRVPSIASLEEFKLHGVDGDEVAPMTAEKRDGELLEFVRGSTASALASAKRVAEAARSYRPAVEYPDSALAQKLRTVAQLVDAGLQTRVYYVMLDGFDTHAKQADAHAALLRQLGDAVSAFVRDAGEHGHPVLTMAFSEFGRRLEENASGGTDHGAAAPIFLAGGVRAGLVGRHPSLADLDEGDVKHHTDFRRVYAAVLEKWLGVESAPILGGTYEPVEAIA